MSSFLWCVGCIGGSLSGDLSAFMSSCVGGTLESIWSMVTGRVGEIYRLSSKANELCGEIKDLEITKVGVLEEIRSGEPNNKECTPEAKMWLDQVDSLLSEAEKFQTSYNEASRIALHIYSGLCRDVEDHLKEALRLKNGRSGLTVLREAAAPPVVLEPPSSRRVVGAEDTLSEIRGLLENDDCRIIGIYGMGGIGKTTLLQALNNEFYPKESPRFELVIFVPASNEISVYKVQETIAKRLGYKFDLGSSQGPSFPEDMRDMARVLYKALLKKKFLLLIDNLWEKLDLSMVGIPSSENGSKVVFTTRDTPVCDDMDAARWKVQVPTLTPENSWRLFCQSMGTEEDQLDEPTKHLAQKVASKCGGLPLAVVVLGKSMASASRRDWEAALRAFEKGAAVELRSMEKEVLTVLKFSFDRLRDDRLKECLLYFSLLPKDCAIYVMAILPFWLGEGFLDRRRSTCSLQDAHDIGYTVIRDLKAACLLEDVDPSLTQYQESVRLHNTVWDMARWIVSGECETNLSKKHAFFFDLDSAVERSTEATRISLAICDVSELPAELECHNLITLILRENSSLVQIPAGFFMSMSHLTVLDLGRTGLKELPSEISLLVELRLLSLAKTPLVSLPKELGTLTKLRFLSLNECSELKRIPSKAISSLSSLQVLSMAKAEYEWEDLWMNDSCVYSTERDVSLSDLGGLKKLEEVRLSIPAVGQWEILFLTTFKKLCSSLKSLFVKYLRISSPHELFSLFEVAKALQEFIILGCGDLDQLIFPANQLIEAVELSLIGVSIKTISWAAGSVIFSAPPKGACFGKLLTLILSECVELEDITWTIELPCLQTIGLAKCIKMEETIDADKLVTPGVDHGTVYFPALKQLEVNLMPNLISICVQPLLFPSLETLIISNSPKLKKLPFDMGSATKIKEIFCEPEWWDELEWDDENVKLKFSTAVEPHYYQPM